MTPLEEDHALGRRAGSMALTAPVEPKCDGTEYGTKRAAASPTSARCLTRHCPLPPQGHL